jgi:hypothetical protein
VKRLALALVLLLPVAACEKPADVKVEDAWARDTIGRTANAAVFLTITSSTPDRLVGASAPIANDTDLMTMKMGKGAMAMEYIAAIDIPAEDPVDLEPSGLHVWLAGLKEPLKAGQTFPLVLEFEKAGEHRVEVSVVAPAATPRSGMEM